MARTAEHGHDITIRLWPELSDAIAAWRAVNGGLAMADMVRRTYDLVSMGHRATHPRPSGDRITVRLQSDIYARVRDAAALAGLKIREFLLRRICDFLGGIPIPPIGKPFGAYVRKPRPPKAKADASLAGDGLSRWPSDVDPVLVIGRTDEWRRWWKDGGVPPFRVPANADKTRHAEKTAERRERLGAERAA